MRMIKKPVRHDSKVRILSKKRILADEKISEEDFEDLVEEYGKDFIYGGYTESRLDNMDDFDLICDEALHLKPTDLAEKIARSYAYEPNKKPGDCENFDVYAEYFDFNRYEDRFISISEHFIEDYMKEEIAPFKEDFLDWCKERGYI